MYVLHRYFDVCAKSWYTGLIYGICTCTYTHVYIYIYIYTYIHTRTYYIYIYMWYPPVIYLFTEVFGFRAEVGQSALLF